MTTGWHLDPADLSRYGQGQLEGPALWSVEAHLAACPGCRRQVSAGPATERIWQRLDVDLDLSRPSIVEWVLLRFGVPEHLARLLAATPAMRASWLLAVAVTLGVGVGAGWLGESAQSPVYLLALVPLVAVASVAAAFGPGVDPTYEIGLVAPFDSFRLVLLRASSVLTVTVLMAAVAALATPDVSLRTAAWLAPALLLSCLSLALSSVLGPVPASVVAGGTWLIVLVTTVNLPTGHSVLFEPPAQTAMGLAAVVAALAVAATRRRFDTSRTFDYSRRLHS